MMRVNVIGTTGSGKSTFSKRLAQITGAPYVEMDRLFWKPNWGKSTDPELFEKLNHIVAGDSWVLDGNYTRTIDIKWHRVQTVIWIDYSYFRTLLQLIKRSLARAFLKDELWEGTGNHETFYQLLFTKNSILVWFFKCYSLNRRRLPIIMNDSRFSHVVFVRLRNPKEAEEYLKKLATQTAIHPFSHESNNTKLHLESAHDTRRLQ